MTLPTPAHILVVDDEPDLRTLYELTLLREGYRVEAASDLAQARAQLQQQRFDAVITDMRLPDGLGLELLRDMLAQQRSERCVVITAHGSAENAVEALKAGAFDYLTKPVDLKQFRSVVAAAVQERGKPDSEAVPALAKAARPGEAAPTLQRLVGESAVMQAVKARIVKVASSMAPVLIQGESGTGKELVARAVHDCSHRAAGPFVAVNCGAIPENLLEAEFFGARKGAYTGSAQDRLGYFQSAKGGTLFLDEIGDLPLAMQSKLLRAIQERVVRPLGSTQEDMVDVRIVSATHKDLSAAVTAGTFRQDLYYRLNVIEISVPPLRERREDLPALCKELLGRICRESGFGMPDISGQVLATLQRHPFNGNVRELENILHRAVALGDSGDLHLESPPAEYVAVPENLQDFLDGQERNILSKVLQETGFNRTAAAAKLGISLRQIRYRIARLNIVTPNGDEAPDEQA
ncbi:sigma-54-dependent transcriptional regulator [Polaromonas sp.]|uniref:sigma-54-dependent transcriptional regulator n=1 Tax=Polaromonas sp. TaxID=1869339 RepID=UPI003CA4E9C4